MLDDELEARKRAEMEMGIFRGGQVFPGNRNSAEMEIPRNVGFAPVL